MTRARVVQNTTGPCVGFGAAKKPEAEAECRLAEFYAAYADWTRDMGYTLTQNQQTVSPPRLCNDDDRPGTGVRRPGAGCGQPLIGPAQRLGLRFALSSVAATLISIERDAFPYTPRASIAWSGDAMRYLQMCTSVCRYSRVGFSMISLRNHGFVALFDPAVANKDRCKVCAS
jgi:hypothetical protein